MRNINTMRTLQGILATRNVISLIGVFDVYYYPDEDTNQYISNQAGDHMRWWDVSTNFEWLLLHCDGFKLNVITICKMIYVIDDYHSNNYSNRLTLADIQRLNSGANWVVDQILNT